MAGSHVTQIRLQIHEFSFGKSPFRTSGKRPKGLKRHRLMGKKLDTSSLKHDDVTLECKII